MADAEMAAVSPTPTAEVESVLERTQPNPLSVSNIDMTASPRDVAYPVSEGSSAGVSETDSQITAYVKDDSANAALSITRAIEHMTAAGASCGADFAALRELSARISVVRIVVLVLSWAQLFGLYLPSTILSAQHRETVPQNLRTVCIVLGAAITLIANVGLLRRDASPAGQCLTFLVLKVLSFVFEIQLFAVAAGWTTLFVFGIVLGCSTIIVCALAAVCYARVKRDDPNYTELQYTRFAAEAHFVDVKELTASLRAYVAMLRNDTASGSDGQLAWTQEALDTAVATQAQALFSQWSAAPATEHEGFPESPRKHHGIVKWYTANRIRKALWDRDAAGNTVVVGLLLIFSFFAATNVGYEFYKIFANQPPLFDAAINAKYNDGAASYFPNRSHARWKVHVVIVDGLRYDMTEPNSGANFSDLVSSPAFAARSVRLAMRSQLPSFSVPNWMTLLSGTPPEITGVTGNLFATESSFDHIYRECKRYGVHTGMTGTPWWRDLVFSTLPELDGDGTVLAAYTNSSFPTYAWKTADPADWKRMDVALNAIVRSRATSPFGAAGATSLYDFFLTHFSDVDMQGHEYGVSTDWNKGNTYRHAVDNKTIAIKRIMAEIDNNTILIVTSDHGHVMRGGHGGTGEELRKVPVIFYHNTPGVIAASAPVAFPATAGPRYGVYENTDFAATVTALLGIPAPRQTTGIFMEEMVRTLVPSAALQQHYYDLFRARYSLVQEMGDYIGAVWWGNVSDGTVFTATRTRELIALNNGSSVSVQELASLITQLHTEYRRLRDALSNFELIRNLVASLIMIGPVAAVVFIVVEEKSVASFRSIFDKASSCRRQNIVACVLAFATVFLYVGLSLAAFLIGYYGVTGYDVWDSTLTHTPSVAVTFLSRTIGVPVVIFILLTRLVLFRTIRWHTYDTICEVRGIIQRRQQSAPSGAADAECAPLSNVHVVDDRHQGITVSLVMDGVANLGRDLIVFVFGTSRYRHNRFAEAYLYLYYVAFWASVTVFILLFMLFPFTFMVPVVFSTPYVHSFTVQWRFRLMTMLLLVMPLLLGTALLLFLRPRLTPGSVLLWDRALLALTCADDLRLTRALEAATHEQNATQGATPSSSILSPTTRRELSEKAIAALLATEYAVTDKNLLEADQSEQ
jgi:hypothetical protein